MSVPPPVRLLILGAGYHAAEVRVYIQDLASQGSSVEVVGFLDDARPAGVHGRFHVLGKIEDLAAGKLADFSATHFITAVGSNRLRQRMVERVTAICGSALPAWTLRHPSSWTGEDVEIGDGTCLAPAALATTRVRIGRHCILNVKASLSHDVVVGDYGNINPGATVCGNVTIGEGAYIGAGAVIKDKVSIGAWSVIGAGAAVVADVPANVTAVGVPARIVKHRVETQG
jgi:sugar O-acyltransferase (sialic acid O-acetyltransferase NeuD family)